MAEAIRLRVNGADHAVRAHPDTPLLYVLRNDLGLKARASAAATANAVPATS